MTVSAIIPAAGIGKRFSAGRKKQFYELSARPVLYYTLTALKNAYDFDEFIIGASEDDFPLVRAAAEDAGINDAVLVTGGAERSDTVYNCINAVKSDYVLIHDSVRPFIAAEITANVIETAALTGGAICGIFSRDTVKRVRNGLVQKTLDRDWVFLAHTPQAFRRDRLIEAMNKARADGITLTDEAAAFEHAGYPVRAVESSADNIKITVFQDLMLARGLLEKYFG